MQAFDPGAEREQLVREALSYAAHGLLFGFGYLPSRHRPLRAKQIRTLVFVHGLGATRSSFFPLEAYLRLCGHTRQLSFNYRTRGTSIEEAAITLKRCIDHEVRGGRIDLIGHSLGGLVARTYVQALGGARRVDRLVTLGTPHHGTHAAAYVPTRLGFELRPNSALLQRLDALPPPDGVRCLSVAAGRDLMILPAENACAPFGENVAFDDLGHLSMLLSPRVFSTVGRFLAQPDLVADARRPVA
jgi:triacylglycerol lipase